ncbi:DNA-binding response regulator [Lachnospiraceae bacterium]|nr:DNA-binding response regulator [Lachnospiraceae bacterium]
MRIAVCDDDDFDLKLIYKNLKFVLKDLAILAEVVCFSNSGALFNSIRDEGSYQLYVLDLLCKQEREGLLTAREICRLDARAQIAFLTGSREYAVEAFELGAIHYLLKPVTEYALRAIVERWQMHSGASRECLEIPHGKEIRKFPKSQILYLRSRERGIEIHMNHHKWDSWVKFPFHKIEEEMCAAISFVKIARGCIVNMEYVSRLDFAECFLVNGEVLSVSRREYSSVRNKYNDFLFWKMKQEGG